MFPNGYNMPFYGAYPNFSMGMNPGVGTGLRTMSRGGGLLSRLTGSIGATKSINWPSILNNASRTLNVVNQAIPIVKQVGPMYNNMKSMLKIASLFKDETDPSPKSNNVSSSSNTNNNSTSDASNLEKENTIINNNYSNSPNFFI